MLPLAGQVIDGKYRLTRLIGTGGMGAVYEGDNILIRRRVAIKVLNANSAASQDIIRRFEREAQAAGEIGNDHILEVLDMGSLPSGERYMVMEYLDGETLADRIERHGRLSPAQISPIARQFLTALASAHAAGIIHRDLKPENIFILRSKAGRPDFVKLIDFGISKFTRPFHDGEMRMTRADAIFGTPCYMSPEQARGAVQADVRSDIYSCGVILFEAVTGKLPFEADSFNDLMFKIALSDAPSPLTLIPSLDPDFTWIINRAIARDPEARFPSVQEFAEKLDEWMRKHELTETLAGPRPNDAFPPRRPAASSGDIEAKWLDADATGFELHTGSSTAESWAQSQPSAPVTKRRDAKLAAAAIAAVVVAAVGVVLAVRSVSARPQHPATRAPPIATAPLASAPLAPAPALPPTAETPHPDSVEGAHSAASTSTTAPKPKREPTAKSSAAPRPSSAPALVGGKPKEAPTSHTTGFDLGY
jgi:eukaryotic-like serine/threonine-protein kinase